MFKELEPPKRAEKTNSVKIGTVSRQGWLYGSISFGAAVAQRVGLTGSTASCAVAIDEDSRKLKITFGKGNFKMTAFQKGGGRILVSEGDWLPNPRLRALPVAIESTNGRELIIALPESWPEPQSTE